MATDPEYGRRHFLKDSIVSLPRRRMNLLSIAMRRPNNRLPPCVKIGCVLPAQHQSRFFSIAVRSCGDCIKACPYQAIAVHPANGSPILFPNQMPCYLCEDFPCITACGTDALSPIEGVEQVHMGPAVVSHRTCTAEQGCNACVSQCPTHALSMDFDVLRVLVSANDCVGCGICEYTCKSVNDQLAIKVRPERLVSR